jgi:ornithine cyclodeaminase
VRIFGRNGERARTFAERVESELGLEAVVAPDVASAVRDAPLVTLVTRATSPFLTSNELGPGTHVNAVGAIVPSRAEFEPDILSRCGVITADSVPQTRALSREFMEYFRDEPDRWARVLPLSELVAADATRPAEADLTLFKAMGVGLSDLALGLHCLARARDVGAGKPLPPPTTAHVRWSNHPTTIPRSSAR